MAHLKDMEELLSTITSEKARDYMTEALSCYMAGAYRGSVVLSFIALFDDVLSKLEQLGKVNKKARAVADAAKQKREDQEIFETYLIDQLKANALLTHLDVAFLEVLRDLRNKSAHPSGHRASAEEARFVFAESISRFLSRPMLSTTQLSDELLASLSEEHLFPSTDISVIIKVVKKELESIDPQAYPYLVVKMLEKKDGSKAASKNARFFLSGLARVGDEQALEALKKHVVVAKAADPKFNDELLSLLSANGKLFSGLDEISYKRLAIQIKERIKAVDGTLSHSAFSHPTSVFISIFSAMPDDDVLAELEEEYAALLDKFCYSAYLGVSIHSFPKPRAQFLEALAKKAGAFDFTVANEFAKNIVDIEKTMAKYLSDQEAFNLLLNVLFAADQGAFSAVDLRKAHFASVAGLRLKSRQYIDADLAGATKLAAEVLGIKQVDVPPYFEFFQ